MSESILTQAHFYDETAAYAFVEARVWPNGPVCPHCGGWERLGKLRGASTRIGTYKCYQCRKPFTVKVGTIFESSHIKLHLWLQAIHLMCASKKGISSNQLHRTLGVTLKTAWFMSHRIREAMRPAFNDGPLGGAGKAVEADETYIGGREKNKHRSKLTSAIGGQGKEVVFSLVERGGMVRSRHVPDVSGKTLRPIIKAHVHRKSILMTDEAGQYRHVGREFAGHEKVNHGIEEYVRGAAYTNTVENYFSILKRGVTGTYHHVSQKHLHRYLAEFDFRYNQRVARGVSDADRTEKALLGIVGRRLTYRTAPLG